MTTLAPLRFAFAQAIALADDATEAWQQILRTGTWVHPQYGHMEITPADLAELKRNFDAGAREFVYVDYDHGIANPRGDGTAVSAGEVKALELRADGMELWALYEPTPRAAELIRAREYRFTSADFVPSYADKRTGQRLGKVLRGFALTNRPFIEGMAPLSLGDAAGPACLFAELPPLPEIPMPIRQKLGLPADATDEQVVAAVDKLLTDAAQATTLSESAAASAATVAGIRSALQLAEDADPVSAVKTLAEQNAALAREKREREADALLDEAVRAGRLTPAERPDWRAQLLHDVPAVAEAARTLLGKMPKRVPVGAGVADPKGGATPETDPEKLLDEKVAALRKDNPTLSYGEALVLAERALQDATFAEG